MGVYQDLQLEKQEKQSKLAELTAEIKDLQDQLAYLQSLLKEPFEITCAECSSVLIITPPKDAVAQVITPLYCPACGAKIWEAPTEGYTVSVTPIAVEVPWYKKYAPHLALGGGLAATLIYFTRKK